MRGERAPLVLAGVEYLLPLYRQASGYKHILDEVDHREPGDDSPADLHERAWELVEPHFADEERAAREAYAIQAGRGTDVARLGEVLRAAHDGRIDTLFVRRGAQRWGKFDHEKRKAEEHSPAQPGDRDLLDLPGDADADDGRHRVRGGRGAGKGRPGGGRAVLADRRASATKTRFLRHRDGGEKPGFQFVAA